MGLIKDIAENSLTGRTVRTVKNSKEYGVIGGVKETFRQDMEKSAAFSDKLGNMFKNSADVTKDAVNKSRQKDKAKRAKK